jgi:predicted kinase
MCYNRIMSNTVIILRGASGSGKSTYTKKNFPGAFVCSADHYFHSGPNGEYNFNPSKLGQAHGQCRSKFLHALYDDVPVIVVDNTNTRIDEMEYYVKNAKEHGYDVEVVRLVVPPEVGAKRNLHGVPLEAVKRMNARMQSLPLDWGIIEKIVSGI